MGMIIVECVSFVSSTCFIMCFNQQVFGIAMRICQAPGDFSS